MVYSIFLILFIVGIVIIGIYQWKCFLEIKKERKEVERRLKKAKEYLTSLEEFDSKIIFPEGDPHCTCFFNRDGNQIFPKIEVTLVEPEQK